MKEDYIKRINKALAFIDANLHTELSLEIISKTSFYSPFHLHRIFKAITGETLNAYITRKRIERSAILLLQKRELPIAEIAQLNGFKSDSVFSRTFKKIYGQSPKEFRKYNQNNFSKISKIKSKNGKTGYITEGYLYNIEQLKNWINMNAKTEIKEMPGKDVAYVTHIGEQGIENAFNQLIKWAAPKGLLNGNESQLCRIFHDSFKITDADKVRMSIGVLLDKAIKPEGEIGITKLKKGKYLTGRFEIEPKDFGKSWESLFILMGEKGYKKADGHPYEVYYNNPQEHPEKKCIVDLCIPIE